jgi:uncharacterized membrane protein
MVLSRRTRVGSRLLLRPAGGLVLLAAGAYAAWVATLLVGRVAGLSAPPYDLAFFQQVVWNVGDSGRWISSFNQGSFLGVHFSPILVVPALAERLLGPDVRILSVLHAIAFGALVPAIYLLVRAVLRPSAAAEPIAAALAMGLPLTGALQEVARSDFHPETAGVALALLAGWAGLTGRPGTMWLLAAAALSTREDVSYAVAVIGLLVAVRGRVPGRRHGRSLVVVAVIWAALVFGVVMPLARGGAAVDTDSYYAWLGGGLGALLAPFTKTALVAAAVLRPAPWLALAGMILALLGLPLLRPRWAALALPPLAALLLSANFLEADIRLQYGLLLVTPLVVAAAMGGRRAIAIVELHRRARRDGRRPRPARASAWRQAGLVMLLLVPAAVGARLGGSLPPFTTSDPAFQPRPSAFDRLRAVAGVVPRDAILAADEGLLAPLADRPSIERLVAYPTPAGDAYVVADRLAWAPYPLLATRHDQIVSDLRASSRPVLADDGRFVVWGPEPKALVP